MSIYNWVYIVPNMDVVVVAFCHSGICKLMIVNLRLNGFLDVWISWQFFGFLFSLDYDRYLALSIFNVICF